MAGGGGEGGGSELGIQFRIFQVRQGEAQNGGHAGELVQLVAAGVHAAKHDHLPAARLHLLLQLRQRLPLQNATKSDSVNKNANTQAFRTCLAK